MAEFVLPADEALVVIDEGRFAGAEILTNRDVGVGVLMTVQRLMQKPDDPETTEEKVARATALFEVLASDVLISWNLVDRRGKPVPLTVDGLGRIAPSLVGEIVYGWFASFGVPAPLGQPSELGEPPAETSPPS